MTPAAIIQEVSADGVTLTLTPSGAIKATGNGDAVKRWHAILREHKPGIVEALREAANDEAARCWQVHFPKLDPMEVIFAPEATRLEVAAIHPGARIERLSEPSRRAATPIEADELRELVALIFADADDAERAEVFAVACADPEAALTSLRLLVDEVRPIGQRGTSAHPDVPLVRD